MRGCCFDMEIERKIAWLQVSLSKYLMKRWNISTEEFIQVDNKYDILGYIRLYYEPLHITADKVIAEEIESYIRQIGGDIPKKCKKHKVKKIITINQIKVAIESVVDEFKLQEVRLFGSYASGKITKKSDIDLIVRFKDKEFITLIDVMMLQQALEGILGKKVNIVELPLNPAIMLKIKNEILLYSNELSQGKIEFAKRILTTGVVTSLSYQFHITTEQACRMFMSSKTYGLLQRSDSYLYQESVEYVLDILDVEQKNNKKRWLVV